MDWVTQNLSIAVQFHQAGKLDEAEKYYRQVLARVPRQPDACHLLGVVFGQRGDNVAAAEWIRRAIAERPTEASFHNNLGESLRRSGRVDEAVASYLRAIELSPTQLDARINLSVLLLDSGQPSDAFGQLCDAERIAPQHPLVLLNKGNALRALDRLDEAVQCYQMVTQAYPNFAAAHCALGIVLRAQGKLEPAFRCFMRARELDANFFEAWMGLGAVHFDCKKRPEAANCFRRALELRPDSADAELFLGRTLSEDGFWNEAEGHLRRGLSLRPDDVDGMHSLGSLCRNLGKFDEATALLNQVLKRRPERTETLVNLGNVYHDLAQFELAYEAYRRAISFEPTNAEAHAFLGVTLLSEGRFEEAWPEYQWRLKTSECQVRALPQPVWRGELFHGQTLFVQSEQGLGDMLQMARYLKLAKQRGGRIVLECHRPLIRLFSRLEGLDEIVSLGEMPSQFDLRVPLLDLPQIFRTDLSSIPNDVPYLSPDPLGKQRWETVFANRNDLKVGVVWQGNPIHSNDQVRSCPLIEFAPLASVPGVRLFSLQKGFGTDQLAAARQQFAIEDFGESLDKEAGPFMDTAAIMTQLDLVVTIDSAAAHLAGALGVPTWVMLQFAPDWRWLRDRDTSPWYPTMRLFRQRRFGDWPSVVARMAEEVRTLVRNHCA